MGRSIAAPLHVQGHGRVDLGGRMQRRTSRTTVLGGCAEMGRSVLRPY